jgi:2,3-bisphosphoglycerate-dependent phosphoglycerate mutase
MERELSEKGLSDRVLVTEFLDAQNIDVLLSSPYKRSVDTIKDFADKNDIGIHLVEDFRERKIDDCWIEDFDAFAKKQWEDFDYKLSGGESLREVQKRNINAVMSVLQKYPGKNIVVGSHGTALSMIIKHFDDSFDYESFVAIKNVMPWVVKFVFEDEICVEIEKIDLFAM